MYRFALYSVIKIIIIILIHSISSILKNIYIYCKFNPFRSRNRSFKGGFLHRTVHRPMLKKSKTAPTNCAIRSHDLTAVNTPLPVCNGITTGARRSQTLVSQDTDVHTERERAFRCKLICMIALFGGSRTLNTHSFRFVFAF